MAVAKAVPRHDGDPQAASLLFRGGRLLALSVPIAGGLGALLLASAARLFWRSLHESRVRPTRRAPALVLGAGSAGTQLVANMLADPDSPYLPVGLLDDDSGKRHLRIQGIRVLGNRTALKRPRWTDRGRGPDHRDPVGKSELFRDVSESARALGLKVKVLPNLHQILDGTGGPARPARHRHHRPPGPRPGGHRRGGLAPATSRGKRVLVTGAGGSIGSELCRQLVSFDPARS